MTNRGVTIATAAVLTLAATTAAAQVARPERPNRSLFAAGRGGDVWQSLNVNGTVSSGFDESVASALVGENSPLVSDFSRDHGGVVNMVSAGADYMLRLNPVTVGLSAGVSGRYLPSLDNPYVPRKHWDTQVSVRPGVKGLSVDTYAKYQPYSLTSLYPSLFETSEGMPLPYDDYYPASAEHYFGYGADVGYEHFISKRTSIYGNVSHDGRLASGNIERFMSNGVGGGLRHNIGRGLDLRAGYGYSLSSYESGRVEYGSHLIDVGVDFNRSLSFSRRTTVSFGTGTSAVDAPGGDDALRFRVNAHAQLNHEIGRSWNFASVYSRAVEVTEFWPEPIASDTVMVGLTGLISRRLQFSANAQGGVGDAGYDTDTDVTTYNAGASLSYAFSRFASIAVNYTYYKHSFEGIAAPAPGYPNDYRRNSVMASVNLWAPLFEQVRRANASR